MCQRTKQNFFLTIFSSFLSLLRRKHRRREHKRKTEENKIFITLLKKGQNSSFSRCAQEREFCLKPLRRKGEKANKNTKDLHHLKSLCRFLSFSLRSEYYCSYSSLILLIEERDERERVFTRALLIAFFKVAETKVYLSSLL